ncbi:MAG: DUF3309 domain-containing protein [Candidatus Omnitrophica bacterium]|nr:DUF3309 domain-containing protein [Candidatus Omnitrophota bacterium]
MTTETLLLVVLIILFIGALPSWPYSKSWGYAPTGILALLLAVFLIWAIAGGRPLFRSSGQSVRSTVEEAGQDLKAAGRDVADSVRDAVQ